MPAALVLLLLALAAAPAQADMTLPAGFRAQVYVTGEGFDTASSRGTRGIPSSSTLAFDATGTLYLARTGRRYTGGEVEDIFPVYRIPAGGARLTPATERRYFYAPPLPNPQVAGMRGGRELLVTTFDRDRKIGVLYRIVDGHIELVAGGTPPRGTPPVLRQPEGAAVNAEGHVFVADREQGVVVRFDSAGKVVDPRYAALMRPRILALSDRDGLWVAGDGPAEAPWQRGPGEIWRIGPQGAATLVLRGPVASGMALGPGGHLFVADRQGAEVFAVHPDGRRTTFARFSDGDAPRGLVFAPDTPATRKAGFAGDLFVVVISRGAWPVNEVVRISGGFDDFARSAAGR
jgi:hypothetical protein